MKLLRRKSRWHKIANAGGLLVLLVCAAWLPAYGQGEIVPREVTALFDDISDIDKLRVLNPLKLTPDQLDRLITAIRKAQDSYNKKLSDAAVPPIKQIAADIKETRRKMLTSGGTVPTDFDTKVKKIQDDFMQRRDEQDVATLKSLSDAIRAILTPEQVDTAASLARKLTAKDGKATLKGEDAKFFNYYVLGTFIVYPRIIPLLEDMKKAATESGGAARRSTSADRIAVRAQNQRAGKAVPPNQRAGSLSRVNQRAGVGAALCGRPGRPRRVAPMVPIREARR